MKDIIVYLGCLNCILETCPNWKWSFFNQEQSAFHFLPLRILGYGEEIIFIPSSKSSYPVGNHILFILPSNSLSNPYSYFYAHYNFLSVSLFFKNVIILQWPPYRSSFLQSLLLPRYFLHCTARVILILKSPIMCLHLI